MLFIFLKGKAKIWNYEGSRIVGYHKLRPCHAEHIELYG